MSTTKTDNSVECKATHLSSFAVLVDVQGSSTASHGSVIIIVNIAIPVLLTITYILSLCQLSAMLGVVYQSFLCFLQCLQLHIGGMYVHFIHVTTL